MRRTMNIIRRLTARSAGPDLVLAAICSMVAAGMKTMKVCTEN